MAIFTGELTYRADNIAWLSQAHRIATTVVIGQSATTAGAYPHKYKEASMEVYLHLPWDSSTLAVLEALVASSLTNSRLQQLCSASLPAHSLILS
jgi:hypothetical protein